MAMATLLTIGAMPTTTRLTKPGVAALRKVCTTGCKPVQMAIKKRVGLTLELKAVKTMGNSVITMPGLAGFVK